ncbi:hypothetical protein H0264_14545 [Nocardia huaxiensis]|uniref:ParB/Sulfiredoxin domain-containing protein n=1 Tax=Nocardia huaxiensis TaxID=2755382 RepID=A0A7D6ZL60_9NOCA|nr:hypothetical protein [Nocardia huaxiensis]QLY33287.1 hypothetical protein H0264_14545 [Nocardia huaxiensis]
MHLINPDNPNSGPERTDSPGVPQIVQMDAAMARRELERNTNNRPVRLARVQQYLDDMNAGRWRFNGEAIKFAEDGQLLDGQHRLMALARTTGLVLPMLVVRNLPRDTQVTMDQGTKRSPADQLALAGLAGHSVTMVAAALRVYLVWMEGNLFGDVVRNPAPVSTTKVVEFAEAYPDVVTRAERFATVATRVKCRPAVACAVAIRLSEIDDQATIEFIRLWDTGVGLDVGSPILALRERLDSIRTTRTRTSDRDFIGLIVAAWNHWRRGKQVSKLQRPKGGWTPENFPEPR